MKKEMQEMIRLLEERLKWYQNEATDEQFDSEEVYMIAQLLHKLYAEEKDSYYNAEDSLKRFQIRYHINFDGTQETKKESQDKKLVKFKILPKRAGLIKAAAIFAVFLAGFLGFSDTTQALREGTLDFFQILQEDEMGKKMVINGAVAEPQEPEASEEPELYNGMYVFEGHEVETKVYTSWDEVPVYLNESVWIPQVDNITVKRIEATDGDEINIQDINVCYMVGEKELWCSITIYGNVQATVSKGYGAPLTLREEIETDFGLSISIMQAEVGDYFGEFLVGRSSYLFSGEFTQEEFNAIMKSVERCSF